MTVLEDLQRLEAHLDEERRVTLARMRREAGLIEIDKERLVRSFREVLATEPTAEQREFEAQRAARRALRKKRGAR